jgi:hypothetical protein
MSASGRNPQPVGSIDLLTAQARYACTGPAGVASWASRAPRIAGDVVVGSALTSCRADATAHARTALLLICRGGQPPGTASWGFNSVSWGFNSVSWGFNSVSWGFNSAFMVIWVGLRGRGGGAKNAGQQRKAVTALS